MSSPDKGSSLPADIKARLIAYANCNRCELTPDDARQIVLLDDMAASSTKKATAQDAGFDEWIARELPRATGYEIDLCRTVWIGALASAPSATRRIVDLGVVEFHPNEKLRDDFYNLCRGDRGWIVDLWLLDIQTTLRKHGYDMIISAPTDGTSHG